MVTTSKISQYNMLILYIGMNSRIEVRYIHRDLQTKEKLWGRVKVRFVSIIKIIDKSRDSTELIAGQIIDYVIHQFFTLHPDPLLLFIDSISLNFCIGSYFRYTTFFIFKVWLFLLSLSDFSQSLMECHREIKAKRKKKQLRRSS